ncbi:MAG: sigma-70 family RNA polymerase sigma factor [Planctomycetota bacterium]
MQPRGNGTRGVWQSGMKPHPDDLQRLLAEAPFVRALAQSLVAGDADDLVQQAWLRALRSKSATLQQPRRWLARILRNLAHDRRRRDRREHTRQRAAARSELVLSSAELLAAEEHRRALVLAVDALPEHLRTVVLLRYYEDLPPRRIAAHLGVPVSTVWNRLHAALQALRQRLDARHGGDRRAWLVPLVPFAAAPRHLPWRETLAPAAELGVMTMTTKTKWLATATMLAIAVLWVAWPEAHVETAVSAAAETVTVLRVAPSTGGDAAADAPAPRREQVATLAPASPSTGALVVHVRHGNATHVEAGMLVLLRSGVDLRVAPRRGRTDAAGDVRFEGLPPGPVRARVAFDLNCGAAATVVAGEAGECTVTLREGMTLRGLVVDPDGLPVAGATVEGGLVSISGEDAQAVATTDADGTFVLRGCAPTFLVGARAEGLVASPLQLVRGRSGADESVRIELGAGGAVVAGQVVDADGPVAGATVRVGAGRTEGINPSLQGAPPLPAQVQTDTEGRFTAIGIPAGQHQLLVRDPLHAPWRGTCEVDAHGRTEVRVTLTPGVTCRGCVRDEAGDPVAAVVMVGRIGDFDLVRGHSSRDGSFVLTGLPVDDLLVQSARHPHGKGSARVHGVAGTTVVCELTLSNGLALRGRVVDADGAPVGSAQISAEPMVSPTGRLRSTFSHGDGGFLFADCKPGRMTLRAAAPGYTAATLRDVEPGAREVELRLQKDTAPRATIRGRLLRPDGSGAVGESVEVLCAQPQQFTSAPVEAADGAFAVEVAAGRWWLRVLSASHPELEIPGRELLAGEVWDLGEMRLTRGGTLRVHPERAGIDLQILDAEGGAAGRPTPPRPTLLAPGTYTLLARADGMAAMALPFAIEPDRETGLDVRLMPGVRQLLVFAPEPGVAMPTRVDFEVSRDGQVVLRASARGGDGAPPESAIWLAPGDYELSTRIRSERTSVRFTVGDAEGTVRLALR